jgi:hypothetical protein
MKKSNFESKKSKVKIGTGASINTDKLNKLKQSLINLDPNQEITEVLGSMKYLTPFPNLSSKRLSIDTKRGSTSNIVIPTKSINLTQDLKFLSNLQSEISFLQKTFFESFSNEIVKKSDTEIKKYFPEKVKDYKGRVQVIIDKEEQQYNTYLQQLNNLKDKNNDLKNQILLMKIEEEKAKHSLYDTNLSIEKLKKKYEIFSDLFPYYNTLLNEFDYDPLDPQTPMKIVKDIKMRRKQEKECSDEIISQTKKIDDHMSTKYHKNLENRQKIEELSTKIRDIEQENKYIVEEYQNKITFMKDELSSNQILKNENIKLHNMLISIYNELFPKLNLEREINYNAGPGLELIETDCHPRTYDMEEVIRYINLMIKNGNEASSGNLLRELIAFTNMILRDDREVGQNYDPASVIKEIEKLIGKNELENNNLNNKIENLKNENCKDEEIIKKLERKIKNYEKKYEILHLRINDLFNEKNNIKKKENDELIKKQKEESKKNDTSKKQKEFKFEKYQNGIDIPENVYEDRTKRLKFTDINKYDIMDVLGQNLTLKALKQFPIFHNEKRKYQDKTNIIKVDYIDSAKNLVDHANRLFLYKSRTTPVTNVINNEESVKRLDRKLNKLKQIQKSNIKLGSLEAEVEAKINNNLDRVIKGIRAQEGEKKNDFLSSSFK